MRKKGPLLTAQVRPRHAMGHVRPRHAMGCLKRVSWPWKGIRRKKSRRLVATELTEKRMGPTLTAIIVGLAVLGSVESKPKVAPWTLEYRAMKCVPDGKTCDHHPEGPQQCCQVQFANKEMP